jgi:beta-galactosidase
MKLGVCYYPEHWPREKWAEDARRMADMGLRQVRIGEFAWSRIEPEPGRFDWAWLDEAVDTLAARGLEIVMGTPTATPPKWLIDRHPDVLAWDRHGRPRGFGSRRHYCFSSPTYARQAARIVTAMAERYGRHPAIKAWQTDNEYGCHDTIVSYSPAAATSFRAWLKARHGTIDRLNAAWGNVFWSMEYRDFAEIDPPSGTVTEANPAHRLDWQRHASDAVVAFNRMQVDILRALSPGRDLLHNYMGMFTSFDHFDVAADLDVAAWDSYPLGFLETFPWPTETKLRYLRQGHPDFTAFHHDLYRAVGRGRWQVIEQQPGPVNWAAWNPAPLPGMVRAWTWEAIAHGAECVSYFRWRQAPFAQEQMHAGLLRPDDAEAPGADEARRVARELAALPADDDAPARPAPVALVFDYPSVWSTQIQPQGADFSPLAIILAFYGALRRLGVDVEVRRPDADFTGHALVVIPHLPIWPEGLSGRLRESGARVVIGPRAGSKTVHHAIPDGLAPGGAGELIALKVVRSESLRPGHVERAGPFKVTRWLDVVESDLPALAATASGHGIWRRDGLVDHLACWPDEALLHAVLGEAARAAGLPTLDLPEGLRLRRRGTLRVAINHAPEAVRLSDHGIAPPDGTFLVGQDELAPAGVAAWREPAA